MSKRRKGMGSVIQVRKLNGLGDLGDPKSGVGAALPVLLGGLAAGGTTIGIRHFMTPTTPGQMSVMNNAPWIGLGAGVIVGLGMWNMTSQPAGVGAIAGASVVALSMVIGEMAAKMRMASAGAGTAGVGAVVAYGPGQGNGMTSGVGAIVMEPHASRGYGAGQLGAVGSYGETVNLGAIRQQAFGTPGFQIGAN